MKKIISIMAVTAVMLFAGMANAQTRLNVGYAPQTFTTTYSNGGEKTFDLNGFFVGASYNTNLTGDLNVSVGVDFRYNTKSDKNGGSLFGVSASTEVTKTQMLVEVPVLLNYGLKLNKDLCVSAFAGPTFSMAFSGKTTTSGAVASWGGSSEYDWYSDGNWNQFDIALTFGLDLGIQKYHFFGGYNMGLLNLTDADNTTIKTKGWFVGLGYDF